MAAKPGRPYEGQVEDLQSIVNLEEKLVNLGKENFGAINKILGVTTDLANVEKLITEDGKLRVGVSKDQAKNLLNQLSSSEKTRDAIRQTAPGAFNMAASAKKGYENFKLMSKSALGIVGIILAIGKAFLDFQKAVTDTRKELGVSYTTAASITAQTKALGYAAKVYGLEQADIASAATSIRKDLGTSVQESLNLSLNFARTAAATGQTADQMVKTLSVMESISSASRDVLLNQMRTTAAMIEAAGVAPGDVMKDIADNAEYFAKFAKDGGMNLINAGVAARKLGLSMSAVAGISESLLNFESSIEKQLEASLLLGRQINFDKARQLAFLGKHEEMLDEVLRLVGGEAEFTKMQYHQRKVLAESVGVSVEQLSRLVRNNAAAGVAGVGAQVGAVMGDFNKVSAENSGKILDVAERQLQVQEKTYREFSK